MAQIVYLDILIIVQINKLSKLNLELDALIRTTLYLSTICIRIYCILWFTEQSIYEYTTGGERSTSIKLAQIQ